VLSRKQGAGQFSDQSPRYRRKLFRQHQGNDPARRRSRTLRPRPAFVQMPQLQAFRDGQSYYATPSHEVLHWTPHESRLNRDFGQKRFDDAGYAVEELVAEIGAAFLCADLALRRRPAKTMPPVQPCAEGRRLSARPATHGVIVGPAGVTGPAAKTLHFPLIREILTVSRRKFVSRATYERNPSHSAL
jgi:hypothetical protein